MNIYQMIKVTVCVALLSSPLLSSTTAFAVNKVQGTIKYWDDFSQRSNNYGTRLATSSRFENEQAYRVILRVYGQDGECIDFKSNCPESDDDYLAEITTDEYGTYSYTLETDENDIYLRSYLCFSDSTGENREGCAKEEDGTYRWVTSPMTEIVGTVTKNWNLTCYNAANGLCPIDQDYVVTYYGNTLNYTRMMASIALTRKYFGENFACNGHNNWIIGYYPETPYGDCEDMEDFLGTTYNGGIALTSWDEFVLCGNSHKNHIIAHEIGHVLHRRRLNLTTTKTLSEGCCTDQNGDPIKTEKCETVEGWARFFAAAIWFQPYAVNPSSDNILMEGDIDGSRCVSINDDPHLQRENVARFFWDLYDSTTVGTNDSTWDNANYSLSTITHVWDDFYVGSANHYNYESGCDGRNIWDYYYWDYPYDFGGEIFGNCLESQATD